MRYVSLVQQQENFLHWLTGLRKAAVKWPRWKSTASYWKPLYNILESSDLNAMVVNARHMKDVPGRKTDVKDAEWNADLL